jgi:hypothetical protein
MVVSLKKVRPTGAAYEAYLAESRRKAAALKQIAPEAAPKASTRDIIPGEETRKMPAPSADGQ